MVNGQGGQPRTIYVDAEEKEALAQVKSDTTPYRGNSMKDAKAAMDALENKVRLELQGERDATLELIEEKITDLRVRSEFQSLGNLEKEQVVKPLMDQKNQTKEERFIGNRSYIPTTTKMN